MTTFQSVPEKYWGFRHMKKASFFKCSGSPRKLSPILILKEVCENGFPARKSPENWHTNRALLRLSQFGSTIVGKKYSHSLPPDMNFFFKNESLFFSVNPCSKRRIMLSKPGPQNFHTILMDIGIKTIKKRCYFPAPKSCGKEPTMGKNGIIDNFHP